MLAEQGRGPIEREGGAVEVAHRPRHAHESPDRMTQLAQDAGGHDLWVEVNAIDHVHDGMRNAFDLELCRELVGTAVRERGVDDGMELGRVA